MLNELREQFYKPGDEYTPIPFWFWNDALHEAEIRRQIHDFKEKGVMGFVIHPRIGIPKEITYLSDRFMELVRFAVEEAACLGMKVVLYDEAMYPSGSAHGRVVEGNPEYATRGLKMVEYDGCRDGAIEPELEEGERLVTALAVEKRPDGSINPTRTIKLHCTDGKIPFQLPEEGSWSVLLFVVTYTRGHIRGIHFGEDDKEPWAPPSADLLNPAAMRKFIDLTHERYYSVLKDHFGSTIVAMFTDEPDILGRGHRKGLKPWTDDFLEFFLQQGNSEYDLPALWLEAGEETEAIRRKYKKAVNRRLETTYYKQISDWCGAHGIALTGHPHGSDDIGLLKYFHIPGQDIVWRWVAPEGGKGVEGQHSTMAKCSSDAARHRGRRKNANECFGCCGPKGVHWAFSAGDMKWYLDWLFVRGVNLVYPHAFYYSLDGERRYGERPPDVGPNNIWWKYYNTLSDYMKRMCWLMTDSVNTTSVAVLCREDFLPWAIAKPLYENQIEFNYLEDNLLLSPQCRIENGRISIEKQEYRALLVESADMLIPEIEPLLRKFAEEGGSVVIHNPQERKLSLKGSVEIKSLDETVQALDSRIKRDCLFSPPNPAVRVSHTVKAGIHFYLLVNEGEFRVEGTFHMRLRGRVEKWDAWMGTAEAVPVKLIHEEMSAIPIKLERRESVILSVDPGASAEADLSAAASKEPSIREEITLDKEWEIQGVPSCAVAEQKLESWTLWPGMEEFSGTLVYETAFQLETLVAGSRVELDLGRVGELAHVHVNGRDAGFALWAPYLFDLTEGVRQGMNTLKVEVTNTLANRISKAKLDSGLLGSATITRL